MRHLPGSDGLAVILSRHVQAALRQNAFKHLSLHRLCHAVTHDLLLLHDFGFDLFARRSLSGCKQRFGVKLSERCLQHIGIVFACQFRQCDADCIQTHRGKLLVGCGQNCIEELCRTLIQCIVVGDQCRQTVFEFRNTVVKAFCAVTQRL